MEEWKEYELGELITLNSGGTPDKSNKSYWGGDIPWISAKFMYDDYLYSSELKISQEGLDNGSRLAPKGSILLLTRGSGLFNRIPVCYVMRDLAYNQDVKCLESKNKELISTKFLFYWLMGNKNSIGAILETTGIGAGKIDTNRLKNIRISLPPKEYQQALIGFAESIMHKIELNRRINDNLEQQTQALFKSWFVDNPKPNWSETTFSEVANFIGGYSYKGEELTDSSNIAMVPIKNFGRNGGFKADGFKGIAPFVKLKECHYANLFDILVAHTDLTQNADVIGNAELLLTYGRYDGIIFSMDLVKVLPKNNFPYRFLLAAMLKNKIFKGHCLGYVNGTTVLHLSKKALPNFEVKIPPKAEAKTMNDALAPYYQRMAEVLQENDRLIHLRDTLLPKLMSGELNINAKSRLQ